MQPTTTFQVDEAIRKAAQSYQRPTDFRKSTAFFENVFRCLGLRNDICQRRRIFQRINRFYSANSPDSPGTSTSQSGPFLFDSESGCETCQGGNENSSGTSTATRNGCGNSGPTEAESEAEKWGGRYATYFSMRCNRKRNKS